MSSSAETDAQAVRNELLRLAESGLDYGAAHALAMQCVDDPDRWTRVTALHALGYIARVYGRLDSDKAVPQLRAALTADDAEIAAAAADALDDIATFLPDALAA